MNVLRSSYNYELPEELIASEPAYPRGASRMLVLNRERQSLRHHLFSQISDFLEEGCLLVVNNTRVIPARLPGVRESGGKFELLLVDEIEPGVWRCKVKNSARLKAGERFKLCDGKIGAMLRQKLESGDCIVDFEKHDSFFEQLEQYGYAPLPPYIHKVREKTIERETDLTNYQTLYAKEYGAIAAPTAGLHFNDQVFENLGQKGIETVEVTLHVGVGTFEPIRVDDVTNHKMHEEAYDISQEVAEKINSAKQEGKKVVAVGTTVCRTLESAAKEGNILSGPGKTRLFIYPPYQFQIVDQLITNFHLPESTLLMLVSAFASKDYILKAYNEAVSQRYRFFSYGDCMLIQ